MSKLEVLKDGTRIWENEKGQIHREDGPAIVYPDGFRVYLLADQELTRRKWLQKLPKKQNTKMAINILEDIIKDYPYNFKLFVRQLSKLQNVCMLDYSDKFISLRVPADKITLTITRGLKSTGKMYLRHKGRNSTIENCLSKLEKNKKLFSLIMFNLDLFKNCIKKNRYDMFYKIKLSYAKYDSK